MKKEFILDRVQELNHFFKFIVERPVLFNIGSMIRSCIRLFQPECFRKQNRRSAGKIHPAKLQKSFWPVCSTLYRLHWCWIKRKGFQSRPQLKSGNSKKKLMWISNFFKLTNLEVPGYHQRIFAQEEKRNQSRRQEALPRDAHHHVFG